MSRPTAVVLLVLFLLAGTAGAGNIYPDQQVDSRFAPLSSPAYWRRVFSSGTVDEKGVSVARTPDGGFVALISVPGGSVGSQIGLLRYGPDAALFGGTFGSGGKRIKDAQLVDVRTMMVDSQGRIVVVGTTPGPGGLKDFRVLRFNPDGSDDTSFGTAGGVSVGMEPVAAASDDHPVAVVEQVLDGGGRRLVIAGNSLWSTASGAYQAISMIGLRNDGSLDPTFGDYADPALDGRLGQQFVDGYASWAGDLLKLPDNGLLLVGTSVINGTDTDFAACLFASYGMPYSNSCGSFPIDQPGPGGSLYDNATAAVQTSANTIVLAGNSSGRMAALRLRLSNYTLQLDTTFVGSNLPGRPHVFFSTVAGAVVNDVAVRSDGSLLLAGYLSSSGASYGAMTRLRRDGSADAGSLYSPDGFAFFVAPTLSGSASASTEFTRVLVDGGKPVLYGSSPDSTSALTDYDGVLTRLNSDLIFASRWE